MAVFKCKMCGGDLEILEGMTVCECEYCGTKQTVPHADNEKKMTLFARANRLRFACEFDKAFGVYESIVAEFPEEAEAYWGLVLCKYGIEYVDDPKTGNKIPTCHRSSFDCVMEDSNFEMVLEYSDGVSRPVYREEAKTIERLRTKIIEVSAKEEPYDIFICYKETSEDGQRTIDSVIAQEVYDELVAKGYRVFFSRISLEDKLGQEYEAYIFAALNSAKVMLAFGTDYEYFNAVWVKNEWSRFLSLIMKGEKKTLIPCYKDIDVYDMPTEFKRLQAQDMGKIGAMQDLVRGIEKIIGKKEISDNRNTEEDKKKTGNDALLRRARLFLEEKNWDKVLEYCEQVLDAEPENPHAYFVKEMAENKCRNQEELEGVYCTYNMSDGTSLSYARRFADEKMRLILEIFDEHIINAQQTIENIKEKREKDPESQKLRQKLKAVRERANLLESRAFVNSYATYVLAKDGTITGTSIKKADDDFVNNINTEDAKLKDIKFEHLSKFLAQEQVVGLSFDGSVHVSKWQTDADIMLKRDLSFMENWDDISKIMTDWCGMIYGIKNSGTVVRMEEYPGSSTVNESYDISKLRNVSDLLGYTGKRNPVFKLNDGTLAIAETIGRMNDICEETTWNDIVELYYTSEGNVGLKKDGTLVATRQVINKNPFWNEISKWTDIIQLYFLDSSVVALNEYGEIFFSKKPGGNADEISQIDEISSWKDIAKIYIGCGNIYGLNADGTLLATKYYGKKKDYFGQDEVRGTRGVSGFIARGDYNACILKDGTLIAKGKNTYGRCDVFGLKMFDDTDQLLEEIEKNREAEKIKKAYEKQCAEIEDEIQKEISARMIQITEEYELEHEAVQRKIKDEIEETDRKLDEIRQEQTMLQEKMLSLGVFKAKEKKEIQARIDALQKQMNEVPSKQQIQLKYQPEITEIDNDRQKRIKQMNDEVRSEFPMPKIEDFTN